MLRSRAWTFSWETVAKTFLLSAWRCAPSKGLVSALVRGIPPLALSYIASYYFFTITTLNNSHYTGSTLGLRNSLSAKISTGRHTSTTLNPASHADREAAEPRTGPLTTTSRTTLKHGVVAAESTLLSRGRNLTLLYTDITSPHLSSPIDHLVTSSVASGGERVISLRQKCWMGPRGRQPSDCGAWV